MVNVELLKETLQVIEKNPHNYDQSNWVRKDSQNVCGTAMCIAGHAAVLSGQARIVVDAYYGPSLVDADGDSVSAACVAEEELRLSDFERSYLFFCMNNEVAIKRMDQVISLWEQGDTLDDIRHEDLIEDPDEDERE